MEEERRIRKLGRTEQEKQDEKEMQSFFSKRLEWERKRELEELHEHEIERQIEKTYFEPDYIEQIDDSIVKTGIIVDIEILRNLIGEEITYKNLCELMNWKYDSKSGHTKKAQIKALTKVVEIEEVGTGKGKRMKIIRFKKGLDLDYIKEQINKENLVSLIMKSILEQIYFQTKNGDMSLYDNWFVTNRELSHLVGLTTREFQYIENDVGKYAYTQNYDVSVVKDITQINKSYVNKKIGQALTNLSESGCHLITWTSYAYKFKIKEIYQVDDEKGVERTRILEPTLDTIEWMNKVVIPRILREFKCKNLSQIKTNGHSQKFWERVSEWIREHCIDMVYKNGKLDYKWSKEIRSLLHCQQVVMCHRIGFDSELIEETYNDKEWQLTTEEREFLDDLFLALEIEEQLTKGEVKLQIVSTLEKTLIDRHKKEKDLQESGEFREKYWFRAEEEYVLTGKLIIRDCHSYTDYRSRGYYRKDDEATLIPINSD